MKNNIDETLQLFVDESREHLNGIEDDLLTIEKDGINASDELIDKVFRAIHTMKGSASFFNLCKIKNLSHAMENVLGKIRSREIIPNKHIISILLDGADTLRTMVNDLSKSDTIDITNFVKELDAVILKEKTEAPELPKTNLNIDKVHENAQLIFHAQSLKFNYDIDISDIFRAQQDGNNRFAFLLEIDTQKDTIAINTSEEDLVKEIVQIAKIVTLKKHFDTSQNKTIILLFCVSSMDKDIIAETLSLQPENVTQVVTGRIIKLDDGNYSLSSTILKNLIDIKLPPPVAIPVQTIGSSILSNNTSTEIKTQVSNEFEKKRVNFANENSLRVSIHILDKLMTLAGEMVLTRNELLQNASARNMQKIVAASQRVDSITSELQEAIMSTRMQSIGVVFSKFRRVVRDLADQLSKKVHLEIDGEDVELDKSIIEAVGDPLTHIVRNSVDHGIETPDVRLNAGKPPEGNLKIRACHEAGQVVIEIIDDGKGIDPLIIRKKAKSLGFCDEITLAAMNDREVVNLIFKPGFSTAEKVTDVSGRGVGMDVVQNNLMKVGGAVDIESVPGKGTTIRIKLPLTLAIIPSLLVIVEGERYAIPQTNLVELVRIPAADVKNKIEMAGGAAVMRLRGELLPLIRVSDVLGKNERSYTDVNGDLCNDRRNRVADRRIIKNCDSALEDKRAILPDRRKSANSAVNVVVVAAGDFRYGLIVDALLDSSEIVVKPLGYHLCDCREYAGATILGDGQVALILDVVGIRRLLEMKDTADKHTTHSEIPARLIDLQSFLIIENGLQEFFAIPVGLIARIEKIKKGTIQNTAGKQVVQYRGGSLRLLSIEDVVNIKKRDSNSNAYAVIFQIGSKEVGIIISGIIDTVEIAASEIDEITHVQAGIIGSVIVKNSIVLILDLFGIVKLSAPELCSLITESPELTEDTKILIVDDSVFFRHQISAFVEDAGYATVCAEDGEDALDILKNGENRINLVLTDIEMPKMNGLELSRAIRADQSLKHLPVIAITSVSGDKARKTGLEAGIDDYLIKLDRESVISACKKHLSKQLKLNKVKELV
jgi:two-component system chemotaxis sensor kinase CheA